jgi:hypothetical protein
LWKGSELSAKNVCCELRLANTDRQAHSILKSVQRVRCVTSLVFTGILLAAPNIGAAESNIIALWNFDEFYHPSTLLADAGPNYWDLRLDATQGKLVPGRFGGALQPLGDSGMTTLWAMGSNRKNSRLMPFPHAPREFVRTLAGGDWTLEFWLRLEKRPNDEAVILAVGPKEESPTLQVSVARGGSPLLIRGTDPVIDFQCPTLPAVLADGKWHHVAFVFSRANCEINHYLDGKPRGFGMPKVAKASGDNTPKPGLVAVEYADSMLAAPNTLKTAEQVKWESQTRPSSVQFLGTLTSPVDEEVKFEVEGDNCVRLEIDSDAVIEQSDGSKPVSRSVRLEAGKSYDFSLEAFNADVNNQSVTLYWSWPGHPREPVPAMAFTHSPLLMEAYASDVEVYGKAKIQGCAFSLGRDIDGEFPLPGAIDELCFSRGAKYMEEFSPSSFAKPAFPAETFQAQGPCPLAMDKVAAAFDFGKRKHVFIDDMLVESADNSELRVHGPLSLDPTDLKRDLPSDSLYDATGKQIGSNDSVTIMSIYDYDGKIRAVYSNGGLWSSLESMLSLTETDDGLHFDKPALGKTKWRGSTQNNILMIYPGQGGFVVDRNPAVPEGERIKYFSFGMERGVHIFTSPDGIDLKRSGVTSICTDIGGGVEAFWDDQVGEYKIYLRHEGFVRGNRGAEGRAAFLVRVQDPAQGWRVPKLANPEPDKITEEYPIPFQPNESGQVYRTLAIKYPWAPDTYLAFPWRMIGDHVIMQSELATSRDGISWTFHGIKPAYVSVEGESGRALLAYGLVRRGDEIWQYGDIQDGDRHGIHRARQRLDGFTSYSTPKDQSGTILTKPLRISGDQLLLNVAARGPARVAIVNPDGTEIPGFELDNCQPIKTDAVEVPVEWKGSPQLSDLKGTIIRLKFELQDADLFAFEVK